MYISCICDLSTTDGKTNITGGSFFIHSKTFPALLKINRIFFAKLNLKILNKLKRFSSL